MLVALVILTWLPFQAVAEPGGQAGDQSGMPRVIIDRPGEGETYYSGPDGPRTTVPIFGRVIGGDFDPAQVEVQLDVLQDGKPVGHETGSLNADGQFTFRVLINTTGSGELGTPEQNCYLCHGLEAVAFPNGPAVVRVTAVEPTGRATSAERKVNVDQAGVANVAVQVNVKGQGLSAVAGLVLDASTRLYDWRNRRFTALTNAQGRAEMQLEALALAPTHYTLNVAPIQVDGVLYQTPAPVNFDLPPGALTAGPIDVAVEAQLGQVSGTVSQGGAPVTGRTDIQAVQLPYGRVFTGAAEAGRFTLDDLPMGEYLLGAEPGQAAALRARAPAQRLALDDRQASGIALELAPGAPGVVRGTLRDQSGVAVPFGWLGANAEGLTPVAPASGRFTLYDLPAGARTLAVSAPGYWSRTIPARSGADLDVRMQPKPGTHTIPWGSGALVVPDGVLASANGVEVRLQRGWLWGQGDSALTVITPEAEVTVYGGSFALEYLSGEYAWLYLFSGKAGISRPGGPAVAVMSGEMCAFAGQGVTAPVPVPLSEAAIRTLWAGRTLPVVFEPQPGGWARVQDFAAHIGIMDFSPFSAAASLLVFGLCATGAVVVVRRRSHSVQAEEESGEAGGPPEDQFDGLAGGGSDGTTDEVAG